MVPRRARIHLNTKLIPGDKQCIAKGCDEPGKDHWDNGLYCGNNLCDKHFAIMVQEDRQRSW